MQKGCPKCGRMIEANLKICPYCKYDFKEINSFFKKISDEKFVQDEKYAGLIKRLVAGLFDIFITAVFTYFILIIIDKYLTKITVENLYYGIFIFVPLYLLYNSIFERTSWQGTLGKYIVGIIVTDEYENPETFSKALVRNIAKILNIITLGIGFILSAFPPQKQALNDKAAHTFVLNKLVMKEDDKTFYSNPFKRLFAFIVDTFVIGLICYAFIWIMKIVMNMEIEPNIKEILENGKNIICLVIILFYFPFSESRSGTTFGKNLMKIKLVKTNQKIAGFITCIAREILLVLDIITLGFLLTMVTRKKQTLKDILTNTIVIDK